MPAQISLNNFSEGMVPDTDKSVESRNSYDLAENLRYIANKYANTGTLHSVESSRELNDNFVTGERIIGHQKIRDYVIIFTTTWVSASIRDDRIHRFQINETAPILDYSLLLWRGNNLYTDTAGANADVMPEMLSTVGRYEDSDNIKVYWANSTRPIRVANVSTYLTTDGAAPGTYLDQERFNLVTGFDMISPDATEMISGSLVTGRVDYAYSLLKENGQESVVSPTLDGSMIPLFASNIEQASTVNTKGDSEVVDTGKGVSLDITVSSDDATFFDKIRLYRIHYQEYAQLPQIVIVGDYIISGSGSNTVLDTGGSGLGEYTAEEFSILSSIPYSAYTIEEKDNVLFAGNVTEEVFDIDFDARAYRFNSTGTCNLYADYGSYVTPEYTLSGASPNYASVADDANCINAYNDIENDNNSTYQYRFQSNSSTVVGGEGPEVEYEFDTTSIVIDSTTSSGEARTYNGTNAAGGISDYSNPLAVNLSTGYLRGEIYRFGLVFYDDKGNKTPVKWIGDIRMPGSLYTSTDYTDITDSDILGVFGYPIRPKFTLKNGLPSGAVGWEVVRAERRNTDATIISSGYISRTMNWVNGGENQTNKFFVPVGNYGSYTLPGTSSFNSQVLTYVSDDFLFDGQVNIKNGDYIDMVGEIGNQVVLPSPSYPNNTVNKNSIKYLENKLYSSTGYNRYTIDKLTLVPSPTTSDTVSYPFASATSGTYHNSSVAVDTEGFPGTSVVIETDSAVDFSNLSTSLHNIHYAKVKRDNPGRYGGYDYQSRVRTSYISGSEAKNSSSASPYVIDAIKGDTYICFLDYANHMFAEEWDGVAATNKTSNFVIFPIETRRNLSLRYDDHHAKEYSNAYSYLMREYAGEHFDGANSYQQTSDLYKYNSVYSQEQNIDFDFTESDVDLRTAFDARVVHSDKKFDDEYIDSWTKFRANNFLDLESKHGPIKSLIKHNNVLYFAQDDAFGALSVNQRSLISDNNPGQLALGTGGTLERFDYINEYYGTQHKKSINANKGGIFFIDRDKESMLRYSGNSFEVLSDSKGFRSIMTNATIIDIPFVVGNDKNNEVYWKFDGSNVLVFNNFTNTFISNYTFSPDYIGDTENVTFHRNSDTVDSIHGLYATEGVTESYGSFDGGGTFNDSVLRITNNDAFFHTKAYDNLLFYTSSKLNDSTPTQSGERNTDKFDSVRYWNDYQYTGVKTLTLGTTLKSRERGYATDIPRNIVSVNGTTNIDIFDPTNHNAGRTFKERMRDKYITAELTYENSATKGQLSVPFIGFKYRKSHR